MTHKIGDWFTAPKGDEYRLDRIYKKRVKLTHIHKGLCENYMLVEPWELDGFRKHAIPRSLSEGDKLMWHGQPARVTSTIVMCGRPWVGITCRYGGESDHENLYHATKEDLINDGFRELFNGEKQ